MKEETSLEGKHPQLITVAGKPDRDPRKHVVTIAYSAEVEQNSQPIANDDAQTAQFYDLEEILKDPPLLAFDHYQILTIFISKQLPYYKSFI